MHYLLAVEDTHLHAAGRWSGLIPVALGALFATVGWLSLHGKEWFLDMWLGAPGEERQVSRIVTRLNVAMFGGKEQHERFRRETMPRVLGALFLVVGLASIVTGVVFLIIGKQLQTN